MPNNTIGNCTVNNKYKTFSNNYNELAESCRNLKIIYVHGMGCSSDEDNPTNVHYHNFFVKKHNIKNIEFYCNSSKSSAIKNVAKTICNIKPSKDDSFIKYIYNIVVDYLEQNKQVVLIGHSYGGSIVSRIAEILNRQHHNIILDNLYILTFGSIYIPTYNRINKINIKHVLYDNDIANSCNGIDTKNIDKKNDNVFIIKSKDTKSSFLTPKIVDKWNIHISYLSLIADIIKDVILGPTSIYTSPKSRSPTSYISPTSYRSHTPYRSLKSSK